MFDFILLRDTPPDVAIPLKPVLIFFEDKKMRILRDYIENICRIRQRTDITLDELTALVEDLYLGHTEPPLPPPTGGLAEVNTGDGTPALPVGAQEPGDDTDTSAAYDPKDGVPAVIDDEAPAIDLFPTRNPALSLTFAGMNEGVPPPPPLPRLRDLIEQHARVRFVRRLFQRNEHRFEETIDRLEELLTWKEASRYLLELYQTIDLDPYDPDMVEFTDTIHRRYAGTGSDAE